MLDNFKYAKLCYKLILRKLWKDADLKIKNKIHITYIHTLTEMGKGNFVHVGSIIPLTNTI